jgi:hypothetical protein
MFLAGIDEDVQAAIAGELLLLMVSVRQSPEEAGVLLHPDFFEFDPSGRRWDRRAVIAELARQQVPAGQEAVADVSEVNGIRLSEDVVFVTYISEDRDGRYNRSSVWRKSRDGWRLYFHQGTMIS